MEVKTPDESKGEWDYYNVLATVPARRPSSTPPRAAARSSSDAHRARAPTPRTRRGDAPVLSARGLRKEFAGFVAVKDVDIDVHDGQIQALIGPNGAGKSTVFNLLTKFLQADAPARSPSSARTSPASTRPASPAWASSARSRSRRSSRTSPSSTTSASPSSARAASPTSSGAASRALDTPHAPRPRAPRVRRPARPRPRPRGRPLLRPQARARDRHHPRPRPAASCCSTSRWPAWATRTSATVSALISRLAEDRAILMVEHNLRVVADLCDEIIVLPARRDHRRRRLRDGQPRPAVREAYMGTEPMPEPAARRSRGLNAWYGESHVLHGVDLDVARGETVTLLGRNGVGKTTTLRAIMGIIRKRTGTIALRRPGPDAPAAAPHRPRRHRLRARGARHLREPDGAGEPDAAARGRAGRHEPRRDLRAVPQPRPSAAPARAPSFPAASSRCSPSPASCAPASRCCCSTSRPRASRRSSSQRIGEVLATLKAARHDHPARRAELPLRLAASPTAST